MSDDTKSRSVLILSSGAELYANEGIIGIDADLQAFHGYDGALDEACAQIDGVWQSVNLTPADRVEIADEMIRRWAAFRAIYETPNDELTGRPLGGCN